MIRQIASIVILQTLVYLCFAVIAVITTWNPAYMDPVEWNGLVRVYFVIALLGCIPAVLFGHVENRHD